MEQPKAHRPVTGLSIIKKAKILKMLDFLRDLWYNKRMENDALTTSTTEEMVTISRAEYEGLLAQKEQIAKLEQKVNWLMEQLRLVRHRQFGSSSERISEDAMEYAGYNKMEGAVHCGCWAHMRLRGPAASPAQRVAVGKEEQRNERAFAVRRKRGIWSL